MKIRLAGFVFMALTVVGCGATPEADRSIRKVKVVEVHSSAESGVNLATTKMPYPAKVISAAEVNRSFRVAGVIESVTVREGQFVREGEVIATLDPRDYATQLSATQAEYDAIKAEVDRVVKLYAEQSVTANDNDKAVNGLKQITAKLEAHTNALTDTKLTAPFDGYIQRINFDRGEAVAAGMAIVSIISAEAPELIIYIPANEYIKRDKLHSATATIELYGDTIFNLKHIGTTHKANLNQLYEARFEITPQGDITPSAGMTAMVQLHYNTPLNESVNIPFSAVVEREGESYVWLIEGGKATLRKVTVSEIGRDGEALIVSGLSGGEVVIAAGVNSLKEGQMVEALPEPPASNVGNLL